jgi:hypothetical protein
MRRLLRILLNTATVLLLVLFVGTVAAWVRSYQASDLVWWSRANPRLELAIVTYRGGLIAEAATNAVTFSAGTGLWNGCMLGRRVTRRLEVHKAPFSTDSALIWVTFKTARPRWDNLHAPTGSSCCRRRFCPARGSPRGGDGRGACA